MIPPCHDSESWDEDYKMKCHKKCELDPINFPYQGHSDSVGKKVLFYIILNRLFSTHYCILWPISIKNRDHSTLGFLNLHYRYKASISFQKEHSGESLEIIRRIVWLLSSSILVLASLTLIDTLSFSLLIHWPTKIFHIKGAILKGSTKFCISHLSCSIISKNSILL